jgi:hypothetical protein
LVKHDADDGSWQFHHGAAIVVNEAMIVALNEIIKIDESIKELADLPYGWTAWRKSKNEPWQRISNE